MPFEVALLRVLSGVEAPERGVGVWVPYALFDVAPNSSAALFVLSRDEARVIDCGVLVVCPTFGA